jgi:hypothetical protein
MTSPRICYDMQSGLDINVCPVPVKTDVGQVDLVSWLSDRTSEKMTGGYFLVNFGLFSPKKRLFYFGV